MSDRRRPAVSIRQILVAAVLVVAVGTGALPLSGVIAWATAVPANSTLHELPTPKGERSQAYVVDKNGSAVGATKATMGDSRTFLRHDSTMGYLGTLDGSSNETRRTGVLEKLGRGYAPAVSERNRLVVWPPSATPLLAALARAAETGTPLATAVAGATPITSDSQSDRAFVWDAIDVTVELREDSAFHVTERDRIEFIGGPFRSGFREIPLARIDAVDNIRVGEVTGDTVRPYRYVSPGEFSADVPNTYTYREVGPTLRIEWSFPRTTSQARTFQIDYDAFGALRVYDEAETPYQQLSWIGVGEEITENAPVNRAVLRFVLPRPVDPGRTFIQGPGSERPEDHTDDGKTWIWTANNLREGDSLEADLQFEPLVLATEPSWQAASDQQEQEAAGQQPLATPSPSPTVTPSDLTPPSGTGAPAASPVAGATPIATPVSPSPCRDVMRNDFTGKTRDLLADCTTDRSIFIPDSWVFDGGGHTIFAVDPYDGRLTGGVLNVTGTSGTVRNVTIDGSGLTVGCVLDRGQTALTGVVLRGASGEVSGVTMRNLARPLPAAATAPAVPPVSERESCGTGIAVLGRDANVAINETVIENVGYVGILVEVGQASISHNTIDRAADTGILALLGAHVRISPGNQIRNANVGIQLEGDGTGGRVAGNTIETMALMGVAIIGGAQASVANNSIADTAVNGIAIEGSTTEATVEKNQLDDPGDVGLKVLQAYAEIRDNTVSGGTFAIGIGYSGTAQVVGNTVNRPQNTGIYVLHEGTNATIDGNTVVDAASDGIWVEQGAHATITGNAVTDAKSNGITAIAGATVTISGDNIVRGGERGIAIGGAGTTGTVTGNRVEGAGVVGITVADSATAPNVSSNTVTGTQFGITTLGAGTSATVTDNNVSGLERTGFTVEDGATAELRRNHVIGAGWGIVVIGSGTTAELSENQIEETTTAGIVLATGSQTLATSNSVSLPGINGIRIADTGTTATVRATSISGAAETGIRVEDGSQATIENDNQVTGGKWGISVLNAGTTATVHGNEVSGVTSQGISVLYGARATVSDNAITGGDTGVLVGERGSALVEGNTIRDVTSTGITLEHAPAPAAPRSDVPGGGIAIVSLDIFFDPNTVTIPANTDVTVNLPNEGAAPHNFSIDALGIDVDIAPGVTEQVVINATAGEYEFYCNVPGHKQAGMVGTLIVSAGTPTPAAATPIAAPAAAAELEDAIRRNTIEGGQFGIVVKGAGSPITVEGNHVRSVETTGISIEDQALADLADNTVADASTGIRIARAGTSATLTGNRVTNTTEHGIHVQLGAAGLLRKNTITRAGTSGIVVAGSGTAATLEGNVVSNAVESSIAVESAATATIDKGNFVSGGKWGISILSSGTSAEVRGNRVRNVTNQGISVLNGAKATIADNQVTGGTTGIYLRSAGTIATVTGNWVSNTVTNGIYVLEGATGERIEDNTVSGGVTAILISNAGSSAVVSANTVREFSDIGIQVGRGATAEIASNEVIGGKWGIAANNEATTATIRQNTVSGTQYQSIGVVDGASATVDGNTVSDGTSGIYVWNDGSRAVITGNSVSAQDEGIYVWEGAAAERIANNTVTGGGSGIVIEGEGAGTTMVVEANRISDVSQEGIAVRDGASVEISRNDVTHVGFGIQFSQGARGTVNENLLIGVRNTGIRLINADTTAIVNGNTVRGARLGIEGSAHQLTFTDNIVEDSRQFGIQAGPNAVVEVTGNTITGPDESNPDQDAPYGIRVFAGVSGTITGNQVANHANPDPDHTACGIVIDAEAPYVVVSENLFPDPANEVDMCDERPRLPTPALTPKAQPGAATPGAVASPAPIASPAATPVPAATSIATPVVTATSLPGAAAFSAGGWWEVSVAVTPAAANRPTSRRRFGTTGSHFPAMRSVPAASGYD